MESTAPDTVFFLFFISLPHILKRSCWQQNFGSTHFHQGYNGEAPSRHLCLSHMGALECYKASHLPQLRTLECPREKQDDKAVGLDSKGYKMTPETHTPKMYTFPSTHRKALFHYDFLTNVRGKQVWNEAHHHRENT